MPIFEFQCRKCGKEFEELILPSDSHPRCPQCQNEDLEKLLSAFSFRSKGGSTNSTAASSSSGCSTCSSKSCSTCGS